MILNKRWYSSEGFILEIDSNIYTVNGKLFLPENFYSIDFDFCGIVSDNNEKHEVAFVINWNTQYSISYTAFNGKINNEGNLLLNWLLSSQSLNSTTKKSVSGSSTLFRSVSRLKTNQEVSPSLPYPLELQNTCVSSKEFSPSIQHYLQ